MAVSEKELERMRRVDERYLPPPVLGSRRMGDALHERGYRINRQRMQGLMCPMGIQALYPKRRTSVPDKAHKVYPYLLTEGVIERAN